MKTSALIALSLSLALSGLPAHASVTDEVMRDLRAMGYSEITVSRTLLGRERITATGPDGWREIIVNPRTGEILRDVFLRSGGNSGRLLDAGGGDDDDSGADDSDDGGSDNSGSGGGGSGSGGSGSDDDDSGGDDGGSDDDGGDDGDD